MCCCLMQDFCNNAVINLYVFKLGMTQMGTSNGTNNLIYQQYMQRADLMRQNTGLKSSQKNGMVLPLILFSAYSII